MKKFLSIALSAAMLSLPVLGSAEAGFDSAFSALSAADALEGELTAGADAATLNAFGMDSATVQAVTDLLAVSGIYFYLGSNGFYAQAFVNDANMADAAFEMEDGKIYVQSNLLGETVYSVSAQDLNAMAGATPASGTTTVSINQEQAQQIAQQLMTLNYSFDNTLAALSQIAGKVETSEENGVSTTSVSLTADEAVALLRTAVTDLCATEGLGDVFTPYVSGLTNETLAEALNSAVDTIAQNTQGMNLSVSAETNGDASVSGTIAVTNEDGSYGYSIQAKLSETAEIGVYQITDGESTLVCGLTASASAEDDNADVNLVLTAMGQQFGLDLSATAGESDLDMTAALSYADTAMGSLNLTVNPYTGDAVDLIADTTGAVDIMTLSQEEQQALNDTANANVQSLIAENASALPESVRTLLGL